MTALAHPDRLPPGAACYRHLGPFDERTIPRGLLSEHRLKPDVWGILTIEAGTIMFVWDDDVQDRSALVVGDQLIVPPRVPHHLEIVGLVSLSLAFYR